MKGIINMNIGYLRISSELQSVESQIEAFEDFEINKWYIDFAPGSYKDKIELDKMLSYASREDTILISDLSRLSRDTEELKCYINKIVNKGIRLISVQDGIDTSTVNGRNLISLIIIINDVKKSIVYNKQKDGIEKAKENGVYKGGKPKKINQELFEDSYLKYKAGEITKVKFAEIMGISRVTLDKLLKLR